MKKSTRRTMMMSSLAMLLVAVLALGTATYAWFTASSTGKVQNIQFSATSADGISISFTGMPGTYKSTLDFTEWDSSDVVLSPVSAHNPVAGNTFKFFSGFFNEGDNTITTSEVNLASGNYIAMPLYIYNSGENDITVYLSDAEVAAIGNIRTDAATRVGIVSYAGSVDYSELNSESNPETLITGYSTSFIYEPVPNYHLESGIENATYYGIVAEQSHAATTGSNNHIVVNTETAASNTATTTVYECNSNNTRMLTIGGGKVMKVMVYIWIEGQDIDCFNGIASGTVKIDLHFAK